MNLHAFRHSYLKAACLPVSPIAHLKGRIYLHSGSRTHEDISAPKAVIWMFRFCCHFRTWQRPTSARCKAHALNQLQPCWTRTNLSPLSRGVLSTNTKGVIQCLKRNLSVETSCIAFRAWHCLSAQVGFEPTATARNCLKFARLPPYMPRLY